MYRFTLAAATAAAVILMSYANAGAADVYPARDRAALDKLFYQQAAQPYNWTGMYVGINGGRASGRVSESNPMYGPSGTQYGEFNPKGWFVGATVGANWQFASRWVLGLEGDLNYGKIGASRSDSYTSPWYSVFETQNVSANWWGTARGRIGWTGLLPSNALMLYATGGAAFAEVKSNTTSGSNSWWGSYAYDSSSSDWKVGWTAGGGAEYALDRNWSIKAEYLYVDIGLRKNCYSYSGFGYASSSCDTAKLGEHIVRAGLNYKF